MKKRILLGIDTGFSPRTQHAMRALSELIASPPSTCSLILLTVVPYTQVVTMHPGFYVGHTEMFTPSPMQQQAAEEALHAAYLQLTAQGFGAETTETLVRLGIPADEIVHVAREYGVSLIVLGSHSDSMPQRLRRLFGGSITQQVQRRAPCPVLLIAPPHDVPPSGLSAGDLVAWYTEAIQRHLQEHSRLAVFTPQQAAQQFAPPHKKTPGRREQEAAASALERLASNGFLCRHDVKGEVCYIND